MLAEATGLAMDDPYKIVTTSDEDYRTKTLIVAAGSTLRKLGIPGEEEFFGRGVSQCATCDGPLFNGEVVGVAGGGDSAADEALTLAEYAEKVLLFHRRDRLRAQKVLQERVLGHPKIEVDYNTVVESVVGSEIVTGVQIRNVVTKSDGTARRYGAVCLRRPRAQHGVCQRSAQDRQRRPHPCRPLDGDQRARHLRGRRHKAAFGHPSWPARPATARRQQ